MALTKFTGATDTIQALADKPNQDGGLTAAQLKLKFDQHAIDAETYFNEVLTVELDALDAENVKKTGDQTIQGVKTFGSSPIVPTPTTDMQPSTKKYVDDKMNTIYTKTETDSLVAGVTLGQIPNNSLSEIKMANDMKKDIVGGIASYDGVMLSLDGKMNKNDLILSIKDFGTITGIDDTALIQSVYDYARDNGRGNVHFPRTYINYKITAQINVYSNIKTTFEKGVIIDATSLTDGQKAFSADGTKETSILATVDMVENTSSITLASLGTIAVDDWIKITSNAVIGSTNQPKGEICRVKNIISNTLTLYSPLCDGYLVSDSAKVEKINFLENISFEGTATILGNDDSSIGITGSNFSLCKDIDINKMRFNKTNYAGIVFSDCIFYNVDKCRFKDIRKTGLAYGIANLYATQDGSISNCKGYRIRHLSTTGGGVSTGGVPRRIDIIGCSAMQTIDAGFDCHPGAEDISFINNEVLGSEVDGFSIQARSFKLIGNNARNCARHGIMIQHLSVKNLIGSVSNNSTLYSGGIGINLLLTDTYKNINNLNINNNNVNKSASYGIAQSTLLATNAENIEINNNIINDTGSHGIYARCLNDSSCDNNIIKNVNVGFECIYVNTCDSISVNANKIRGGNRGIRLVTSTDINVSNNIIKGSIVGILADNVTTYTLFTSNNARGCTTPFTFGTGTGNVSANNIS